ncbi:MAG: CPBP family intramembrane metalloprotease [Spirochaetes bacterium]|nr:CPBP family intramembrane metalloprotease [Spirochaetota bacterium]
MMALIIFFILEEILLKTIPDIHLFNYPKYDNSFSKIIDLTFGLIIVALTEELIFRGYCYSYLSEKTDSIIILIIISSLVFGLIHWSNGITPVITATIWGMFAIFSVIRTESILPSLFAHYLIDIISFSEIIPRLNF